LSKNKLGGGFSSAPVHLFQLQNPRTKEAVNKAYENEKVRLAGSIKKEISQLGKKVNGTNLFRGILSTLSLI
jgi:hypothetical protein